MLVLDRLDGLVGGREEHDDVEAVDADVEVDADDDEEVLETVEGERRDDFFGRETS